AKSGWKSVIGEADGRHDRSCTAGGRRKGDHGDCARHPRRRPDRGAVPVSAPAAGEDGAQRRRHAWRRTRWQFRRLRGLTSPDGVETRRVEVKKGQARTRPAGHGGFLRKEKGVRADKKSGPDTFSASPA